MNSQPTQRIEWNGETRDIAASDLPVQETADGEFLVIEGERVHEIFVQDGKLSNGVTLDQIEIRLESPRERILRERFKDQSGKGGAAASGVHIVKAPMPGLVRAIKATVGEIVEKNATLLVLEAMKMENNILAGAKGRVKKILVEQGVSVDKNAPMIEIESL